MKPRHDRLANSREALARLVFVSTLNMRRWEFKSERGFNMCRSYMVRTAAPRFAKGPLPCNPDVCRAAAAQIVRFHITVDRRYA